ncbi:MAG: YfhO family protein [Eubacterium sp.]
MNNSNSNDNIIDAVAKEISNMEEKKSKRNNFIHNILLWLKSNLVYILAFIIPVIIMVVIYIIKEIYPWGDNMYLRSDCYHQYAPFLKELYYKLHNGGSLLYSWSIGAGINFVSLAAYYLASPLNILLLFISEKYLTEMVSFFIILKIGLSGWSFAYYTSRHFKTKHLSVAALSVFYALSSYFAAFSWNIMWLDCMVLLPIIVLGLERLVNERKCFLYCISLGIAVFSNYYIGIMLCIYCVLYFIVLFLTSEYRTKAHFKLNAIKNFIIYSLLAGGLAMCMIIPEYFTLLTTKSANSEFPAGLANYFSILDIISRSLMNVDVAIFSAHEPNVYCTVAIFIMIPLYWLNKKIRLHEKIAKTILIAIFLLSFNLNIPNYIWHGLHFPNSLPCRESFIYIFLILTMCYDALKDIKTYTNKQLYSVLGGAIALLLIIEKLYVNDEYDFSIIYLSLAFIIVYAWLIFTYRKNIKAPGFVIYLLFIIVITESTINTNYTGVGTTSRSAYLEDNEAITTLVNKAKLYETELFYRTEKEKRRSKNDAAWSHYNGMSTFSSTASEPLTDFYEILGLETSYNAYAYYGHTPLTDAIFSVKYSLSEEERDDTELSTLFDEADFSDEEETMYMYKNTYTLPLGFMISSNLNAEWETDTGNPFQNQNNFSKYSAGGDYLFNLMNTTASGAVYTINVAHDSDVYFYVASSDIEEIYAYIYDENNVLIDQMSFNNTDHQYICHVGNVTAGSYVVVKPADNEIGSMQLYAYEFDTDAFIDLYNKLADESYEIDTFKDTYIKGTVTANEDGLLYTSIPYDEGWSVYVDGEKCELNSIKGALIAVNVSQGTHTIEFKYFPQGLLLGIIISSVSLIILIGLAIYSGCSRHHH